MTVGAQDDVTSVAGGIDLAGSPQRSTGVCRLQPNGFAATEVVHSDEELLDWVRRAPLRLALVDAPLSLPRGRTSLDRPEPYHFRDCDRDLRSLGIRFFPISLGPMRMLTKRGMRVMPFIEDAGVEVYEGYPGGAQDLWNLPRKQAGVERLRRALRRAGCWGTVEERRISHDELDAVTLALVARAHLRHRSILLGDPDEGVMVLPEPGTRPTPALFGWTASRANPRRRIQLRGRRSPV